MKPYLLLTLVFSLLCGPVYGSDDSTDAAPAAASGGGKPKVRLMCFGSPDYEDVPPRTMSSYVGVSHDIGPDKAPIVMIAVNEGTGFPEYYDRSGESWVPTGIPRGWHIPHQTWSEPLCVMRHDTASQEVVWGTFNRATGGIEERMRLPDDTMVDWVDLPNGDLIWATYDPETRTPRISASAGNDAIVAALNDKIHEKFGPRGVLGVHLYNCTVTMGTDTHQEMGMNVVDRLGLTYTFRLDPATALIEGGDHGNNYGLFEHPNCFQWIKLTTPRGPMWHVIASPFTAAAAEEPSSSSSSARPDYDAIWERCFDPHRPTTCVLAPYRFADDPNFACVSATKNTLFLHLPGTNVSQSYLTLGNALSAREVGQSMMDYLDDYRRAFSADPEFLLDLDYIQRPLLPLLKGKLDRKTLRIAKIFASVLACDPDETWSDVELCPLTGFDQTSLEEDRAAVDAFKRIRLDRTIAPLLLATISYDSEPPALSASQICHPDISFLSLREISLPSGATYNMRRFAKAMFWGEDVEEPEHRPGSLSAPIPEGTVVEAVNMDVVPGLMERVAVKTLTAEAYAEWRASQPYLAEWDARKKAIDERKAEREKGAQAGSTAP